MTRTICSEKYFTFFICGYIDFTYVGQDSSVFGTEKGHITLETKSCYVCTETKRTCCKLILAILLYMSMTVSDMYLDPQ